MDERWGWVALALVREVASQRYHDLPAIGQPAGLFRGSRRVLAEGAGDEIVAAITSFEAEVARRQRGLVERVGATLLTLDDPGYPEALRAIPPPPPFLLVRGGPRCRWRVSAEKPGAGGPDLGGGDGGVARGTPVPVPDGRRPAAPALPPPELADRRPHGGHRGRGAGGAKRRPDRLARERGREVDAGPGNVSSPTCEGTNRLIQDGAELVRGWEDVVAEWCHSNGGGPCGRSSPGRARRLEEPSAEILRSTASAPAWARSRRRSTWSSSAAGFPPARWRPHA